MTLESLKAALYSPDWTPATIAFLSCVAFVLGAVHALGPGHGKSLALAYFGGARATWGQAVLFAVSVTVAHVLVVLVVGLAALWLTDLYWPEAAAGYLGVFSGLGIIAVGGHLLLRERRHGHRDDHDHAHRHIFEQQRTAAESLTGWWTALALGFSGGVVPCPKAIVILLLSVSLHRVAEGLFLIAAFSLGIAATLLVVGLTAVRVRNAVAPRLGHKLMGLLPLASATFILGLGAFVLVRSALTL